MAADNLKSRFSPDWKPGTQTRSGQYSDGLLVNESTSNRYWVDTGVVESITSYYSGKRRRNVPCDHKSEGKWNFSCSDLVAPERFNLDASVWGNFANHVANPLAGSYGTIQYLGTPPLVPAKENPKLRQKAIVSSLFSAQPGSCKDSSLLNFVWELRDFKNVAKQTKNVGRTVKKVSTVRKFSQTINDVALQYKFGVKPFINDVKKLFTAHKRVEDSLNDLNYARNARNNHARLWGSGQAADVRVGGTGVYSNGPLLFEAENQNRYDVRARCQLDIVYDPVSLEEAFLGFSHYDLEYTRMLLQQYGFPQDIDDVYSIIWEGTPWSFVVDMFTPIGEILDTSRNKEIAPGYRVEDCWMHLTEYLGKTISGTVSLNDRYKDSLPGLYDSKPFSLDCAGTERYQRYDASTLYAARRDLSVALIELSGPSRNQLVTLGQLAYGFSY